MLKLHAVQAHEGDCLILEHEQSGKARFVLVDGGPKETFDPHLARALERIVAPHGGRLDLVVLSHVDGDHVTGLLDLLVEQRSAKEEGEARPVEKMNELWHNSFDVVSSGTDIVPRFADLMGLMSALRQAQGQGLDAARRHNIALARKAFTAIPQGHALAREARLHKIPRNKRFGERSIIATGDAKNDSRTISGLKLRVVGPTRSNLEALRRQWEAWLAEQEGKARRGQLDLLSMSDISVPNLSSIQLIAEKGGKRMLLTGDGRGDHLLEALEEGKLLDAQGGIDVDVLKVPHHGSDRNVDARFFERVRAQIYVISADGKHGNPDFPTLKWIVDAAKKQGRKITLAATNRTPSIDKLEVERPPAEHGYKLRLRPQNKSWLTVELS
jgi:hypothetical protein